jgi:hypothetical protein
MSVVSGLVGGLASGLITLEVASSFGQGLPDPQQHIVVWGLTLFGLAIGFLVGSTVATRATRSRDRLVLFSGLTAGIGGGIVGCGLVVVLLGTYLTAYAEWPAGVVDQVLIILAFPAFGAVGFFAGAAAWALCGLLAGAVLTRVPPRAR